MRGSEQRTISIGRQSKSFSLVVVLQGPISRAELSGPFQCGGTRNHLHDCDGSDSRGWCAENSTDRGKCLSALNVQKVDLGLCTELS